MIDSDSSKFVPCDFCKDLKGPSNLGPGYYYSKDPVTGDLSVHECTCHQKWMNDRNLEIKYRKADVLNGAYPYENYKGRQSWQSLHYLKSIGEDFERYSHGVSVYVYGPNGTQKTGMCKNLGREVIKKGYTVKYLTMQDLINTLLPAFNGDADEKNQTEANKLLNYDLLILDECFDKTKVTLYNSGFQIPYIDSFLRSRTDTYGKTTIYISNKTPDQIASEGFGDSLQNFIDRKTASSRLEFKDEFNKNVYNGTIDRQGLFKTALKEEN